VPVFADIKENVVVNTIEVYQISSPQCPDASHHCTCYTLAYSNRGRLVGEALAERPAVGATLKEPEHSDSTLFREIDAPANR
jgi:hypothetical protein